MFDFFWQTFRGGFLADGSVIDGSAAPSREPRVGPRTELKVRFAIDTAGRWIRQHSPEDRPDQFTAGDRRERRRPNVKKDGPDGLVDRCDGVG